MIKVLHVISDSNIGGAGHHLLALFNAVDKKNFNMEVVLPTGSKLIPLFNKHGVECMEIPHLAEKSFSLHAVKILLNLFKKKEPHIVHTHAALSGRVAAYLYGKCKIVYTRHSVFPPKKNWLTIVINNLLTDTIIAVSPAAKENLTAEGVDSRKITVIYNGMPPATEKEVSRSAYGIPSDIFVLAQIGRLAKIKGHDYVLDAAKQCTNACILFAGDGERYKHVQKRITDESIGNVKLLGFVEDVESLANLMDAQINASFGTEATSLALITGMSLGKPAIASDYGGNPYVIEHEYNGLITPCCDADALAQAINRLQSDESLYAKLSAGAKKRYEARFSDKEMARQTEDLYRGLLK